MGSIIIFYAYCNLTRFIYTFINLTSKHKIDSMGTNFSVIVTSYLIIGAL